MGYKTKCKLYSMGIKFSAVIGGSNLWQSQTWNSIWGKGNSWCEILFLNIQRHLMWTWIYILLILFFQRLVSGDSGKCIRSFLVKPLIDEFHWNMLPDALILYVGYRRWINIDGKDVCSVLNGAHLLKFMLQLSMFSTVKKGGRKLYLDVKFPM